jgi:hypothetical protein
LGIDIHPNHDLEESDMHTIAQHRFIAAVLGTAVLGSTALATVTPPSGYIYSTELLKNLTEGCVATGPGGTFVGIGPGFTANAQAIVLAKESGELRLVAMGFNSISDCAYDRGADTLYVTDNAGTGDLTGALTGDTVFAIPSASTASGLSAPGLELLPAGTIPFAASVTFDGGGDLFVSNAAGSGTGSVLKIVSGPMSSAFESGFDYTGGVAVDPTTGNVFIAESLASFQDQIQKYTPAGAVIMPDPFAGPSSSFGSFDLAFNSDGRLLASGSGGVVSFDPSTGSSAPFITGLTSASGIAVDPLTHRVQVLSSTFTGADEDKSLHRFTPIDQLTAGGGSASSDCVDEAYGLQAVGGTATCTDGTACDADGTVNGSCLFPVGFCFNVSDPSLADCDTSSDVNGVTITAKPSSTAIADVAARVTALLPLSGSSCVFSDGYTVPIQVAGTTKKDGKAKIKVKASTADGRTDSDTFKLVCHPAP